MYDPSGHAKSEWFVKGTPGNTRDGVTMFHEITLPTMVPAECVAAFRIGTHRL
jgi:hypothetical protein